MKILILVGWSVKHLATDDSSIRRGNKVVYGQRYWFFRYMPSDVEVDVTGVPRLLEHGQINQSGLFNIPQTLGILHKLRNYDLVISHHAGSGVFLSAIRKLPLFNYPPHVLIDVGLTASYRRDNGVKRTLSRLIFGNLERIIYHATVQGDFYRHFLGISPGRLSFVPFGVDPSEFSPIDVSASSFVISAGDGGRDYDTLIRAAKSLSYRIVVYSERYKPDRSKLPPNVIWKGFTPISQLKSAILTSRFVVLPLLDIPCSIGQSVLLQSMALGKAVLVADVPGVRDYVINGENACFFKAGDSEDLARQIRYLWNNPEQTSRIGAEGRRRVMVHFTERQMASGIYQALSETIERDREQREHKASVSDLKRTNEATLRTGNFPKV